MSNSQIILLIVSILIGLYFGYKNGWYSAQVPFTVSDVGRFFANVCGGASFGVSVILGGVFLFSWDEDISLFKHPWMLILFAGSLSHLIVFLIRLMREDNRIRESQEVKHW